MLFNFALSVKSFCLLPLSFRLFPAYSAGVNFKHTGLPISS
jgi:hypothetical protein